MNSLILRPGVFSGQILSLLMVAMFGLSACHAQQSPKEAASADGYYLLDLLAYNYTDRYIDSYSVDGQGGGNIRLSSPTSGGSGSACCVRLSKDAMLPLRVHMRWQYGGCTYKTKSMVSDEVAENIHFFYKEADVLVNRDAGVKPSYLEVHFYQDGSLQAQLTDDISPPRLLLDKKRPEKSSFPECKDEEKPI